MTDEQLVEGCIRKNLQSQKMLYERFAGKMMGLCLRYAENRAEAQDLMQDGFIKVFQKIETYRHHGSLEGWIKKVMINTALDNYRRLRADKHKTELDEDNDYSVQQYNASDAMSTKELLSLITKLPTGFRTVFNLYAIEGYNHYEIAEMLNITVGTSKSQYARAKMSLQKMIQTEKILY